jgi:predicted phosphodiesterase
MGELTCHYLERFPDSSSLSLARKLKKDNPLVFASVEAARTCVRHYRGQHGKKNLKGLKDRRFLNTGVGMPRSIEVKYEPYRLPSVNNNCLVLADLHIPFHDENAVELALQYGVSHKINTVILLGDVVDIYDLSHFLREPNIVTFQEERELFWKLIDRINFLFPTAKIFYLEGNHELRFERYMQAHAKEIYDVDDFTIRSLFALDELGITYIAGKQYIIAGDLNLTHGHEYKYTGNSVNPARTLFLKAKKNTVMGDRHQESQHSGKDIHGTVTSCWSIGCLCQLHPKYMPLNDWLHGFGHLHLFPDGTFVFKSKKIINGEIF